VLQPTIIGGAFVVWGPPSVLATQGDLFVGSLVRDRSLRMLQPLNAAKRGQLIPRRSENRGGTCSGLRLHDLVQVGIVNSPVVKRATIKEGRAREAVWSANH